MCDIVGVDKLALLYFCDKVCFHLSVNRVGEDGVISNPVFSSRIHLNLPPLPLHFRVRKTLRRMDSLEIVLNPMALCQLISDFVLVKIIIVFSCPEQLNR